MDNFKVTPEMLAVAANMSRNAVIQSIDAAIQEHITEPETQMGVLILAVAMAFARVRRKHAITGPKRKLVLDKAVEDFRAKVKEFGWEDRPADDRKPM